MAKLLMNILFLSLLPYPVSLHGNAHARGEAELTQNGTDPLNTTRPIPTSFPLVITPSNETINLPPNAMSNTTTNFDIDTDATITTNITTNLLTTNNTDTVATKSSTALATNSTNNTDDTTDSNATNATDTNTKDAIATTTYTTVTNTTANGTSNSNTTVNATTTDTTTNITGRTAKLRNKTNTNSTRTMADTTSTNATIIPAATNSRNIDATIATNSSTNNTSDISPTDTNNASNITNADNDNNATTVNANNTTQITTNETDSTDSINATSTNITKTNSHTNRMECENEPIEANLTTNETTECFSHILSEDYVKEKEGIYIERADVYRISKVYDPCVEGHRRIRPLIIVAVVVTLHSGHPFRLKGEQLVMRVYQEEDECKLLFRRLTCVPPEWFRLLGRYAPEPGKKFGQLVEWGKLVNEKHMTRPMKICDDEFERLVLPDVGSWGKPMFFKRSSENGH